MPEPPPVTRTTRPSQRRVHGGGPYPGVTVSDQARRPVVAGRGASRRSRDGRRARHALGRRQGDHRHRLGPRRRPRHRAAPRARAARGSWSRSGSPSCSTRRVGELTGLGVDNLGVVYEHQGAGPDRRDGRGDGRAVRPRRRHRQQRADLPAAGADGDRERRGRRRLLHVRREGLAVGDAGRVPAHGGAGLGSHRELRVVDGHHRRPRASARTTRRRRRSARSPAPRRASGRPTASS